MRLWEAGALEGAVRLEGRKQLLQHVADKLRTRGLKVTDDMIHLRPEDSPFGDANYAVMVDQYGLFGFADGFDSDGGPPEQNVTPDVDKAFDIPASPPPKQDR